MMNTKFPIWISLLLFLVLISSVQSLGKDRSVYQNEGFRHYISKTLPNNLLLGTKNSITGWNLFLLSTSTAASIALSQTETDQAIQGSLKGSLGDISDIGDIGGNAITLTGITLGTYLTAKSLKNEKLLESSEALIEAEIITAVMTSSIKLSVGRKRPDGSGDRFTSSFPSGHTSGTFALASVFNSMYGYKIGVPLYAYASFVAFSRISDNKHYLSDVLFGAALGTAIGRGVAQLHKDGVTKNIVLLPYANKESAGISLSFKW